MNSISRFAETILFGTSLEEKLRDPGDFSPGSSQQSDQSSLSSLIEAPVFPGRPANLSTPGKASFPALHKLHDPFVRGEILHFFANHELLAMELMALVLLRFPDAPKEFQLGIIGTIREEQSHMRLYLERMSELGVSFGDLPVSDYFWKTMRGMKSPLDFVVQMSLTFEQANLDYSLFYMNAVSEVGDVKTAAVLEKVLREEIGHVKHGLVWFNRWREKNSESEWDAYTRMLPLPMTPQRAKGNSFSFEARRSAGFSEDYIRHLSLFHGSKGRPPVIWHYNPHCDAEIVRAKPGFTATESARGLTDDLQCLPLFLAREQDQILVREKPSQDWIADLQAAGFKTPEFIQKIQAPKIGGLEPWGWSPDSFQLFSSLQEKLVDTSDGNSRWSRGFLAYSDYSQTGVGKLFSKAWSVQFLAQWMGTNPHRELGAIDTVGKVLSDLPAVLAEIQRIFSRKSRVMLKAPYGTSGQQVKELRDLAEIKEGAPAWGWIRAVLAEQKEIVVEPLLNKVADFSVQMQIGPETTEMHDARFFITGSRHQYRGSYLGKKNPAIPDEQIRFLFSTRDTRMKLLRELASRLREQGYQGPAGVDSLLYRDEAGDLKLKAVVEINPRWTMGRVALELEKKLAPGIPGLWVFLPIKAILQAGFASAADFALDLKKRFPLVVAEAAYAGGAPRIRSGALCTNDPALAREMLTVLGTFSSIEDLVR